jgi:Family of unknown function (DUF6171)
MTEKSKWQQYKENLGDTRPWDMINPKTEYVEESEAESRYNICKSCPELIALTKQCKKCGCFMALKTKLSGASCPIGKW